MNQKSLSVWLRVIAGVLAAVGLLFFMVMVPAIGKMTLEKYPEMQTWYWPWLICSWIVAQPCFAALVYFWMICRNIGKDRSFSQSTARYLHRISQLALLDCLLLIGVGTYLEIRNMVPFVFLLAGCVVLLVGLAIAAVAAILSHWIYKSCALQDENNLTI